jgi:hypothetical protein
LPSASSASRLPKRNVADVTGTLGLLGLAVFVFCYTYERAFYDTFGLSPEDVGQGYGVIVGKAVTGAALLGAIVIPVAYGAALYWAIRPAGVQRWSVVPLATAVTAGYVTALYALLDLPLAVLTRQVVDRVCGAPS